MSITDNVMKDITMDDHEKKGKKKHPDKKMSPGGDMDMKHETDMGEEASVDLTHLDRLSDSDVGADEYPSEPQS